MRIDVLGLGFDNLSMDEAVSNAMTIMEEKRAAYVVTPNPEIVWMCRKNEALKQAASAADLILPDGVGIIYGAKILGTPLKQKLPGIDFVSAVFKKTSFVGKRVYLLGGKPGIAEKAGENLKLSYPGLEICGTSDGYFKDDDPLVDAINALQPDLLLVCLGAPKQELWMRKHQANLNVGLMAGLGGALDVFAAEVDRAPEGWQKLGLEWLHRLIKEPRRIKRMIKLPLFLFAVIGRRISGKQN